MRAMNAAADRPRAKSLTPLRALLPFLRPYRAHGHGRGAARLLVATAAMLALPMALRHVIDVLAAKDAGYHQSVFSAGFWRRR